MLIKDVVFYQNLFGTWSISSELKDEFELLHEIGNLYVVPASALKERVSDGFLAKAKMELLMPYLMKREDFLSAQVEKLVRVYSNLCLTV